MFNIYDVQLSITAPQDEFQHTVLTFRLNPGIDASSSLSVGLGWLEEPNGNFERVEVLLPLVLLDRAPFIVDDLVVLPVLVGVGLV